MRRKQNILFFSHSAALYGAERSLLDLLLGIDRAVFTPIVALPAEGPLAEKLREQDIAVHITQHQNWMGGKYFILAALLRLGANLVAFIKLLGWFKSQHIDLIYTNTSATPMGGLLAWFFKIPHLWHIREYIPTGTGGKFYYGNRFSFWFITRASSVIVCNSHQLKQKLTSHIRPKNLVVVHNGILDCNAAGLAEKVAPAQSAELTLAMVGSIGPNKGIADGIHALAALKEKGVGTKLIVVGDGIKKNKIALEELAANLGVSQQLEWTGYLENPASVYKKAHIVLVCSRWESFGRVAVEAGAHGCPVVATNRGGLLEVIEENQTGLFYEPGDSETLTQNILALQSDTSLYNRISAQARKSVYTRFTKEKYINNMTAVIENTLAEKTTA